MTGRKGQADQDHIYVSVYTRTGETEQDRQNSTGGQDGQSWIYKTGQQNRSGRTGKAEQNIQNRTGRTGQAEQDKQNWTGGTNRQNETGRTVLK